MLRSLRAGALVVALGLSTLAACSSDEPDADSAAVDALCADFSWDADKGLTENESRMREIVDEAAGEDTSLGPVLSRAEDTCGDVVEEYFAAVAAGDDEDNVSTPIAKEDQEDPDLHEELEAHGIDTGEVLRLGVVMDATGVGSTLKDPQSIGQAQRSAVEMHARCEAVAAGESTWDDATEEFIAQGAKPGQAAELSGYLEAVFCPEADGADHDH